MARTARRAPTADLAEAIVDAAVALAGERDWQAARMHDIAARLGLPPADLLAHFRDLDAVADAWFRRGLRAMIAEKTEGFAALPPAERVEFCLLAWFDALAPARRVTAQMLKGKLHPPHPHHWLPLPFSLSRLIHWLREAALLPASYGSRRSQLEEIGLSALFLATLANWAGDDSPDQQRTRELLRRRLRRADRLLGCCPQRAGDQKRRSSSASNRAPAGQTAQG